MLLIHAHRRAIVVWTAVVFKFDNLRESRSVPLIKQVLHVSKHLAAHGLNIAGRGDGGPVRMGHLLTQGPVQTPLSPISMKQASHPDPVKGYGT